MTKLRVGVLYGGRNTDHDSTYDAAAGVLAHLDRERFQPVPVRITADGTWRVVPPGKPAVPGQATGGPAAAGGGATHAESVTSAMTALASVDVVFPILHGAPEDDRAVRALLDLFSVPYVGGGAPAGLAGTDGEFTRAVLQAEGLRVADTIVLDSPGDAAPEQGHGHLAAAAAAAFTAPTRVPADRAARGREVSLLVLEHPDGQLVTSPPAHPHPEAGRHATLRPEVRAALTEKAVRIFQILECAGLARVGFTVGAPDEPASIAVSAVDTRPVLLPDSPEVSAWGAAGLSYTGLLDLLIDTRLARSGPRAAAQLGRAGDAGAGQPASGEDEERTGITIYGCAPDEDVLFRQLAPRLGVVATITATEVCEANAELARGNRCVSVGHKTKVTNGTLLALSRVGVQYVSTRSVGYDHIDVQYAQSVGISVGNVFYSPDSVADYTLMQMLMLLRDAKSTLHRTDVFDYRLHEVRGKELRDQTVGVVGTGRIGTAVIDRLRGFGCRVLASDSGAATSTVQVSLDKLLQQSDIVTLHTPLNESTYHLLDRRRIEQMKKGAFVVNTGRGPLIDTEALVEALESGSLGGAALDVIEGEAGIFYADRRKRPIENKALLRLQEMPNVLISPHTAYYTDHALSDTVENSIINCLRFESENRRG